MTLLIVLTFFNIVVLIFAFITKKLLYTVTPEEQWSKAIDAFDKNKKELDNLDITDYKLGSVHIYNNN
jgi:hypothetical protein